MSVLFMVGLGLLLTHELDAMTAKEWRIFPGLSRLDDELGRRVFVVAHVPLFALVFWGLSGDARSEWVFGLNIFMVAHLFAHLLMRNHPENGFRRPLSWVLIGGAGLVGAIELLVQYL